MRLLPLPLPLLVLPLLPSLALADTSFTLTPAADAFVSSANPTSNYGGGGGLCIAAPGLTNGEFQTLMRFDAAPAVAAFNTALGPGAWSISSAVLTLNATTPNASFLFNPQAAGSFSIIWIAADSWDEGPGTPASPGATGIIFDTLSTITSPADTSLGAFPFDGSTAGDFSCTLALPPVFTSDLAAGGQVSLRFLAPPVPPAQTISFVFHSRTFSSAAARPRLVLTAAPTPPPCRADFNHSGALSVQDIFDYLNAWFAGSPAADFNGGGLSVQDIFDFLAAWFTGC